MIRNRKTYWHKCSWTEFVGKEFETTSRTCLTDYVENSTHSNGNKVVNCTTPDPNGISVYADGENSCVLDVASFGGAPGFAMDSLGDSWANAPFTDGP